MAYRFTDTNKWDDTWFSELKISQKAVFLYLCDKCDIAGFLEINIKKISFDLGISKQDTESALIGIEKKITYSIDKRYLFIRNFIKHQKNLPLNRNNNFHSGIISLLESKLQLFNLQSIDDYFSPKQAPNEPQAWGLGNSNSNSMGNRDSIGVVGEKKGEKDVDEKIIEKSWRDNFEMYLTDLRTAYRAAVIDTAYMTERAKYHPGINIKLSLEKACKEFWATESGWKHKKKTKSEDLNWRSTFTKALDQKSNQVWLQKGEQNETGESEKKVAYV